MTALKGADGEVYAIAQGNLVVGGLELKGQMAQVQFKELQLLEEFLVVQQLKSWLKIVF